MRGQTGTRDEGTMRAYASRASTPELRAVLAEARREHDRALEDVLLAELNRREGASS